MASCLLILHFVTFEKSYDRFHPDSDRIYRLRYERTDEQGAAVRFASCCPPAADFIRGAYPEVETIARIYPHPVVVSLKDQDIKFQEDRLYFVEPDFFKILPFKILKGDPFKSLNENNRALISESTALRYFGEKDPLGNTLTIDGKTDFTVDGIFADISPNSHLKFDIVLSFQNVIPLRGKQVMESWGYTLFYTYIKFRPDADPAAFAEKMTALVRAQAGELMDAYKVKIELPLQPLTDIHLTSHYMQEYEANGSRSTVDFLGIIAVFIIIMAWVNYINLSTAQALTRAKEVGMRKVVGATRSHIIKQVFFETLLVNVISLMLAVALVQAFLPYFSRISGIPSSFSIWQEPWFYIALGVLLTAGMVFSGAYPVAALSAFKPVSILRGDLRSTPRGINLRRVLVVFQFVIALVLLTGALTVFRQIGFMKNQDLGFNMDQMLIVSTPRVKQEDFRTKFLAFKEEILQNPAIPKMCVVTEPPGRQIIWDNGGIRKAGEDPGKGKNYQIVGVDYDFIEVFDLKLKLGRNFSKEFPSDEKALILNETAVQWMGYTSNEEALGQQVDYWGVIHTIIGVLSNYHQQSLKEAFEPHIYRLMPYGYGPWGKFALKVGSRSTQKTISFVEEFYAKFFPGNPFEYFFLDDYFNQQYQGEELLGRVVGIFSVLAIFVTGLGIFGMSFFMSLQRTKEIGIRKVLGASTSSILRLLAKDFLTMAFVALFIAWPLTYWGIQQWLATFALRLNLQAWLFLLPLVVVLVITSLTISSSILRAALANPVDSLKHE
jgi:putative ABC transport system permease protein